MDNNSTVYSEKKLASFQTEYKENVISKPQEIALTVTAEHVYGLGFICEQIGTKEQDPVYTRFVCNMEDINKVYTNLNNKNTPIYIQCDDPDKASVTRKRIILPSFQNHSDIVKLINDAKAEFDAKNKGKKPRVVKNTQQTLNDEFKNATAEFDKERAERKIKKSEISKTPDTSALPQAPHTAVPTQSKFEKSKHDMMNVARPEVTGRTVKVDDILGLNEIAGIKPDVSSAPAPSKPQKIDVSTDSFMDALDVAAETPKEAPKEVVKETPKEVIKETPKETVNLKKPAKTTPADIPPDLNVEKLTDASQYYKPEKGEARMNAVISDITEAAKEDAVIYIPEPALFSEALETLEAKVLDGTAGNNEYADMDEIVLPDAVNYDDYKEEPQFPHKSAAKQPVSDAIESIDTEKYLEELQNKAKEREEKEKAKAKTAKPEASKPAPVPAPVHVPVATVSGASADIIASVVPAKNSLSLNEFQDTVKKLKALLDEGKITESDLAAEKKRLLSILD